MKQKEELSDNIKENFHSSQIKSQFFEIQHINHRHKENSKILCILLTRQGKLFTGGSDNKICGFKMNNKSQCFKFENSLEGHQKFILSLCDTSENDFIFSAGDDDLIKKWNTSTYQCVFSISAHNSFIYSLFLTKEGILYSGASDGNIKLWDEDGIYLNDISNKHSSAIISFVELKNKIIASLSWDKSICFWNTDKTENIISKAKLDNICCYSYFKSVFYFEEEDLLLVGGKGIIYVIDTKKYTLDHIINDGLKENGIYSIKRLNDGNFIIGLHNNRNNTLLLFDNKIRFVNRIGYNKSSSVRHITTLKNKRFITVDEDGSIILWEY